MDEIKLKDDLMARLARELERPVLQVIDGALSAVLRDYDVSKRETGLSTEVVSWPEYDIFMSRMIFGAVSYTHLDVYKRQDRSGFWPESGGHGGYGLCVPVSGQGK